MMYVATLGLALVLIAGGAVALADGVVPHDSLEGLTAVVVVVVAFTDDEHRAGFTEETFKAAAERKLRLAGIEVLTDEEIHETPGKPYFYVHVHSLATEKESDAPFLISLKLSQVVRLERNGASTFASTWNLEWVDKGVAEFVLMQFNHAMDKFLNDWLTVNPKEGAG